MISATFAVPAARDEHANGRRVDVHAVRYQLQGHVVALQGSAERPRLALVEGAHGVEGVGDVAGAGGERPPAGLLVGGVCVAEGDDAAGLPRDRLSPRSAPVSSGATVRTRRLPSAASSSRRSRAGSGARGQLSGRAPRR